MKEVFLCTFFAKKLRARPTFKQPTTPRKKERILRILRMISSSHLLSGSFIVSSTPPRGGRNVSSSNSISSNNNNNNNINNNANFSFWTKNTKQKAHLKTHDERERRRRRRRRRQPRRHVFWSENNASAEKTNGGERFVGFGRE